MSAPDDMDYVMQNAPEPSTPRSQRSHAHASSGCPYMRGEHTPNPLPHPHASLGHGASPSRNGPYDPVHTSNAAWYAQPSPPYPWQHPPLPAQPPVQQPRLPMTDQYFMPLGGSHGQVQPPMQGLTPLHGGMPDPFASLSWGPGAAYAHPQRTERQADNAQRFAAPSSISQPQQQHQPPPPPPPPPQQQQQQQQQHHQHHQQQMRQPPSQAAPQRQAGGGNLERAATTSYPRSLPSVNRPPSFAPTILPSRLESSPLTNGGRSSFAQGDSPTRGTNRASVTISLPRPPTTSSAPPPPPENPLSGHRHTLSATSRQEPPVPAPTPPAPASSERPRTVVRSRRGSISRIHSLASDYDSDEEFEDMMDDEEEALRFMEQYHPGSAPYPVRMSEMPEDRIRQHQLLRGAMSNRKVASKSAIASLQSVDINDLPDNERMCIICYNDFGTPTPEGINEAPLRLPKCKHVFGDHCIKKWFEESDSCPYCRDKVPSEPQVRASQAAVANFLRSQHVQRLNIRPPNSARSGGQASSSLALSTAETYMRLMQANRELRDEYSLQTSGSTRGWQLGERRSPPDEREQGRRTRPRHGSFRGSPPMANSLSASNPRPNSFAGATPITPAPTTSHNPPVRERSYPYNPHNVSWFPSNPQNAPRRLTTPYSRQSPPAGSHRQPIQFVQNGPAQPPTSFMPHYQLPAMHNLGGGDAQHQHLSAQPGQPPANPRRQDAPFPGAISGASPPVVESVPPPFAPPTQGAFSHPLPHPVGGFSFVPPSSSPPVPSGVENWTQ